LIKTSKSITQKVQFSYGKVEPFSFDIKRDDLIDPVISGNKWRKLKFNVDKALHNKNEGVLTFGGAYSNHLIATAQAAYKFGLSSVGIVRGEELNTQSNETLRACSKLGMELVFVTREEYNKRNEKQYQAGLHSKFPNFWIVPEGGANYYGAIGCQEIVEDVTRKYDHIYVASGTGTTAAGILSATGKDTIVHAVSALKGDFLQEEIRKMMWSILVEDDEVDIFMQRLELNTHAHFGGYGKTNQELFKLIRSFFDQTGVPLEPIYTGKALCAMMQDVASGKIAKSDKVLFVHSGGLQGGKSFVSELPFLAD
jgi:1-aminocyclopropane-1-carboxylate deaminase